MKTPTRGKKPGPPLGPRKRALVAAEAARDMKAEDIVILEVAELVNYTDYFVFASGRSTRQAQAIAENIIKTIHQHQSRPLGVEGEREGNWILIDWGAVVIHVFYHPVRAFYEIEKLYAEAPRTSFLSEEKP
jgi:ribosome-associated protein